MSYFFSYAPTLVSETGLSSVFPTADWNVTVMQRQDGLFRMSIAGSATPTLEGAGAADRSFFVPVPAEYEIVASAIAEVSGTVSGNRASGRCNGVDATKFRAGFQNNGLGSQVSVSCALIVQLIANAPPPVVATAP